MFAWLSTIIQFIYECTIIQGFGGDNALRAHAACVILIFIVEFVYGYTNISNDLDNTGISVNLLLGDDNSA